MAPELVATLGSQRITFMGSPNNTKFGFGSRRDTISIEPFVQLRGGELDVWRIGAFSYLGSKSSGLRHVESIGRFCSIAGGLITGMAEHPLGMLGTHSMFIGQWDRQWPELKDVFGITSLQITKGRAESSVQLRHRAHRVKIGNDVWIGEGVYISRGVTVGDGAVIAARATVVKDVPPYSIVGGTPARIIKYRFPSEIIKRLTVLKWWRYGPGILADIDWTSPDACLSELEQRVIAGAKPYNPDFIKVMPDDTTQICSGLEYPSED